MTQTHLGTALITGASSGIGAIYADRLARRGYDLILVARNRDKLDALARRITDDTQRVVEVFPADLNDRQSLARVEEKLRQDASITLLVNNAGVGTHTPLLDSNVDAMSRMIDLNVTALTRLTYAAVPGFVARGRGAMPTIDEMLMIAPRTRGQGTARAGSTAGGDRHGLLGNRWPADRTSRQGDRYAG